MSEDIIKEEKKELEIPNPAKFPSVKFIVDENDLVDVTITVAALKDERGEYRPRAIRRDLLQQQVKFLTTRVEGIEEDLATLNEKDPNHERRRIELTGELLALNGVLIDINRFLNAPFKNYTAKFKRITWRDLSTINSESYVQASSGGLQWSDEKNREAKIRYLLKSWDLTEEDRQGRAIPIPINRSYQVDGSIINAFIDSFDNVISLTEEESKN